MNINFSYLAVAAVLLGIVLVWRTKSTTIVLRDAEQMPELALWGYFMILIGSWGVADNFIPPDILLGNAADYFFVAMLIPALLAGIARLCGFRARNNTRPLPFWAAFGFSNALVLGLIGIGKTFLIEPMQIPSSSMRPGLVTGDFILVNKLAYGIRVPFSNRVILPIGRPQRGDVVVFRFPDDQTKNYIKRLIGLPGDTVAYYNKQLRINGINIPSLLVGSYQDSHHNLLDANGSQAEDDSFNSGGVATIMSESFSGKAHQTLEC